MSQWVVVKFGGTSVSSRECWENIANIIRSHRANDLKVLVVCSALGGASNDLHQLGELALSGQHAALLESLKDRYLALADELDVSDTEVGHVFAELQARLGGVALLQELSPKTRAAVMACGERLLTELGLLYLQREGLQTELVDATSLLACDSDDRNQPKTYLSASCGCLPDVEMQQKLHDLPVDVVLTQGFLAGNSRGETVLLGRGGSDVSAAYLASILEAKVCEIWTDVAGVYSANPKIVPKARVIRLLGYDEAQEIAAMGGKVLHPRTLLPLKVARIPLVIKKTTDIEAEGTCVSWDVPEVSPSIKSVSVKKQVVLISIEAVAMWQSAGFLANVFAAFRDHDLSVDLVSTAEACITVSLDTSANCLDATRLEDLLKSLRQFAQAETIGPCAAISLVGSGIRAILSDMSSVLTQFQSHKIYLLSQAANDLNITFVVDEEKADRLCQQLHHVLIENRPLDDVFAPIGSTVETTKRQWWKPILDHMEQIDDNDLPGYFYSERVLRGQIEGLKSLSAVDRIFYATKANSSPGVLQTLHQGGASLECVSAGEIQHVRTLFTNLKPNQILFTPNFAPQEEYAYALQMGVTVTLDGLYPLQAWPELFRQQTCFLRIDPGQGRGHHKHVMTAGQSAKFGLPVDQLDEFMRLANAAELKVVGLHAHAGSGILDANHWANVAYFLSELLPICPDVTTINVGGGLGIAESPWQEPLDLAAVDLSLLAFKEDFPNIQLWMEPGRYLVAESGILIARVTQIKRKGPKCFVGVDTGMNALIRPALYGAHHPIVNLSKINEPLMQEVTVVGPNCESADILGHDRLFPETEEGDWIVVGLAGAYGEVMSSHYNMRPIGPSKLLKE